MPTRNFTLALARLALRPLALALLLLLAAGGEARAIDPCTAGLPLPQPGVVNIAIDGVRGADWDNAAVLGSPGPCLGELHDLVNGNPVPRNVTVYSKRYTNAANQAVVGFFFEVPDSTQSGPCLNGQVCHGERIVLQFDKDHAGAAQLDANDRRIVITHKWGGGAPAVTAEVFEFDNGAFCAPPNWKLLNVPAPAVAVRSDQLGAAGYTAEVEVPLALLGSPASDIGFAFALINDVGSCPLGNNVVCNGFATAFPNSAAMKPTNAQNPATNDCDGGNWFVPDKWGTGAFGLAPGAVTVTRTPAFYNNAALKVYECEAPEGQPGYTWHMTEPCKARLRAWLNNSTGSAQTRNLLFVWSQYGTGDPNDYKVIALLENQTVPNGNMVGPFLAPPQADPPWAEMPTGAAAHPCVRVYVLPPVILAGFDRSKLLNITTRTGPFGMEAMMQAYGLTDDQWTQKNLWDVGPAQCPDVNCRVVAHDPPAPPAAAARAEIAAAAPEPPASPFPVLHAGGAVSDAPAFQGSLIASAARAQGGNATGQLPPLVKNPGRNILMDAEELRHFDRTRVIVQVRTYGYGRPPAGPPPRINLIEEMGGVVVMVPVELLRSQGTVPFSLLVRSADTARTVFQVVDVLTPAGAEGAQVALDTSRVEFAANEERVVHGAVTLPKGGEETGGELRRWGLSLHGGATFPHGTFSNIYNAGPNVGFDLEYRFSRRLSLEGIYTFHRFRGETFETSFGPFKVRDLNLHALSANLKVYGNGSPVRPFFNFGGGVYVFAPGGDTRGGANVGGGLQFDVTPTFAFDGMYNFHTVFGSGSNIYFSTTQAGVRWRF